MEWFAGNIAEAIQSSKRKGSIFVVYVTGEDDMTKEMDKCWDDAEVFQLCKKESVVAIKINHKSESCTFFSQIYPVVVVPSSYFIGNNGVPLEVVGGSTTVGTFRDKVKAVLETHKSGSATPAAQPSPLAAPQQQQQQQQTQAASSASVPASSGASGDVTKVDSEPDEKKARMDVNARVEKAKELIEQKKAEKTQKAEEEERQKEMERRKLGQNVQEMKKFQHERELQEVRDQLKKEKEEQRRARERVKEQIEKDRAERQARFHKEKAERVQQLEDTKKAKLLEQQQAAAEAEARRSVIARIQFRLPDGTSVSNQFQSTETLQEAHNFIAQRLGESLVTLSTAYPRRMFSQADMASTFMDLQLAPTAVLIVVPSGGFALGGSSSGGRGFLSVLLAPLIMIWNFILSFFSSAPAIASNSNSSARASGSTASTAAGGDRSRSSATKRPASGSSRQDGNIRRLRNADDEDDENATWNGNSTQQM